MGNETADYYRFFDATAHAEFLLSCIEDAIRVNLPNQVRYLEAFDQFEAGVQRVVDMPQRTLEVLKNALDNNDGRLSNNVLGGKLSALRPDEVDRSEALYAETLGPLPRDDRAWPAELRDGLFQRLFVVTNPEKLRPVNRVLTG